MNAFPVAAAVMGGGVMSIVLKCTAILALGGLTAFCLWRASAAVRRIINRSQSLSSPVWETALAEATKMTSAPRNVQLLQSDDLTAPVTSGFLNPVVIVPAEAYLWSAERRYIVLVHELAHVARV